MGTASLSPLGYEKEGKPSMKYEAEHSTARGFTITET
jgi:hypothetical protein